MRYNLGYMDKYPIEAAGSRIENNPMYRFVFKEPIEPIILEEAFYKAMEMFPLFKTRVKFDKEYFLETNDKQIKLIKAKEEERPLVFGFNTNDYPWQCCYYENKMTFEWLHGVSDGVGAFDFLRQVLIFYFDIDKEIPNKTYLVGPGLEPFFDKTEKGINYKVDPSGFSFKDFPAIKRGYKTDCHRLIADTKDVISVARICDSSVASIITILFSKAIRMHLPENIKNKNVACNLVLDLRRPLNYKTMHNCVEYKRITYQDKHEQMSFREIAKEYKKILDNARLVPNIVKTITDRVASLRLYHFIKNKRFMKFAAKIVGIVLKDRDCNFVVTYPGKINLPKDVIERIEDIDFKVWHDFGECIIACVDYNGNFNVNISENFVEKGIVEDFIKISENIGIHFKELETEVYEQAHFEE